MAARSTDAASASRPLVAAIVPAHNAAATLAETLRSVRAQTYTNLDIVVVDDGSHDATGEIAREHARLDPRIRLIRQENGGVAAARNAGILATDAEFVAPVDADDVWAPEKTERQLTAMTANPNATLCYTWFACIDRQSRIIGFGARHTAEGDALRAMCRTNLVGNGSGAMMRRDAVIAAGLYDPTLRARGGQGCEDYKLYLALAAAGDVVVVQDFLTGYRILPRNMSSDTVQMCRSHLFVLDELSAARPELADDLNIGRRVFAQWLVLRAIRELRLTKVAGLFFTLARQDRDAALALIASAPSFIASRATAKVRRWLPAPRSPNKPPQPFPIGELET